MSSNSFPGHEVANRTDYSAPEIQKGLYPDADFLMIWFDELQFDKVSIKLEVNSSGEYVQISLPAIKAAWPKSFDRTKDYLLTHTAGVLFSVLTLFPEVKGIELLDENKDYARIFPYFIFQGEDRSFYWPQLKDCLRDGEESARGIAEKMQQLSMFCQPERLRFRNEDAQIYEMVITRVTAC